MIDVLKLDGAGLEEVLSEPSDPLREEIRKLEGDFIVLGAGGKMGPTLAMMLQKAAPEKKVYAVSRFGDPAAKEKLDKVGIKTIVADLLDESIYGCLPKVENVYYLAGRKFGASGNQPLTWAMNSYVPTLVARYYRDSRIVVFSTGNVYPLVNTASGGPTEETPPEPIGEYAQSCLGRERMFEFFSSAYNTPVTIIRLNYANEPRYGIIVDLTLKIMNEEPIDLTMGAVNLIWQRDANDYILRSLRLAQSPPAILNVTGPGTIQVHDLADLIGHELNKKPRFVGKEAANCLLSNASKCVEEFGSPLLDLQKMVSAIVPWVNAGKKILTKPTKYQVRDGKF
jgi:nucleoside-diphosphate-sugar epimerase